MQTASLQVVIHSPKIYWWGDQALNLEKEFKTHTKVSVERKASYGQSAVSSQGQRERETVRGSLGGEFTLYAIL